MATKKKDAAAGATIKVRATQVGFYGDVRRRIGDVFLLYPRVGTFTELELDEKTGKPLLDDSDLIKHRVTKEVENKTLTAEEQFNPKWMEKVAADTPERASTAREVIQQEHDAINREKFEQGGAAAAAAAPATGDRDIFDDHK